MGVGLSAVTARTFIDSGILPNHTKRSASLKTHQVSDSLRLSSPTLKTLRGLQQTFTSTINELSVMCRFKMMTRLLSTDHTEADDVLILTRHDWLVEVVCRLDWMRGQKHLFLICCKFKSTILKKNMYLKEGFSLVKQIDRLKRKVLRSDKSGCVTYAHAGTAHRRTYGPVYFYALGYGRSLVSAHQADDSVRTVLRGEGMTAV